MPAVISWSSGRDRGSTLVRGARDVRAALTVFDGTGARAPVRDCRPLDLETC
jgi:hypothetical protein